MRRLSRWRGCVQTQHPTPGAWEGELITPAVSLLIKPQISQGILVCWPLKGWSGCGITTPGSVHQMCGCGAQGHGGDLGMVGHDGFSSRNDSMIPSGAAQHLGNGALVSSWMSKKTFSCTTSRERTMCDLGTPGWQKSSASWQGEPSQEDLGVRHYPTIIPLPARPSLPVARGSSPPGSGCHHHGHTGGDRFQLNPPAPPALELGRNSNLGSPREMGRRDLPPNPGFPTHLWPR